MRLIVVFRISARSASYAYTARVGSGSPFVSLPVSTLFIPLSAVASVASGGILVFGIRLLFILFQIGLLRWKGTSQHQTCHHLLQVIQ